MPPLEGAEENVQSGEAEDIQQPEETEAIEQPTNQEEDDLNEDEHENNDIGIIDEMFHEDSDYYSDLDEDENMDKVYKYAAAGEEA